MIQLETIYQEHLADIDRINKNYARYKGEQKWLLPEGLDFTPSQNITNYIKKLIDKKARFMFGKEPYIDLRTKDEKNKERVEEKEALLADILEKNKFHAKLLKAKKDCSIGGRIAIKIWARDDKLKIIFTPAQEFFPIYDIDDVDELEKILFVYMVKDDPERENQRIVKQTYEMENGRCFVEEGIYNGHGELIEITEERKENGLDFIPVTIITNGGLLGETKGESDVETLWSNQDSYNKLKSDDMDALGFNMFPLLVANDVAATTIEKMVIAPNALVDLKSEGAFNGKQGSLEKLEGTFSYADKFEKTIDRVKDDMHELMDVPNTSVDKLRGTITSGKAMQVLYWDLQAVCEEEWIEWEPALRQVVDHIFKTISAYNINGQKELADLDSETVILHYYMNPEDEDDQRRIDMQEVVQRVRSRESYIRKWGDVENTEDEMQSIISEQTRLEHGAYDYGLFRNTRRDSTTDPESV